MLRLTVTEKNYLKSNFYKFETQKHLKVIFSSILVFILIISCVSFYNETKINYFTNKLKIVDQFLIKNGFIIKKKSPHELKNKIKLLMRDEFLRKKIEIKNKQDFENKYTLDVYEKNLINCFNKVINS